LQTILFVLHPPGFGQSSFRLVKSISLAMSGFGYVRLSAHGYFSLAAMQQDFIQIFWFRLIPWQD
jgi:hypothetical protein